MIKSKPNNSVIISFSIFLVITIVVIGMNVKAIVHEQSAWYNYAILAVLLLLGGFVLYKIFIRYKVIIFGNNQIEVIFPVLKSSKKYSLSSVQFWIENKVKTGKNSVYKELVIKFDDGKKVSLSHKEYFQYDKVIKYLIQKLPQKKIAIK